MRLRVFGVLLAILSLILNSSMAAPVRGREKLSRTLAPQFNAGVDELGDATLDFDKNFFRSSIQVSMGVRAMGYSFILLKDGQVVTVVTGGKAKNDADGATDMFSTTPSNIGSTIKFMTGVAVLKQMEEKAAKPRGLTVEQQLDQKITTYMPAAWGLAADEGVKQITFRQLLQHRSGFRNTSGYKFYDYLTNPPQATVGGSRVYANINFMMLGYLLPVLADPAWCEQFNQEIAQKQLKPDDVYIRQTLGLRYMDHMRQNLYGAITPAINPSCNAEADYVAANKPLAYMYKTNTDPDNGVVYSSFPWGGEDHCRGQGGWYMSARELAAFVANFAATDKLVTSATRKKMYDDGNPGGRLVWSFTLNGGTWYQDKFGESLFPFAGGDHTVNGGEAHATIVKLPLGYYAVGVANSGGGGGFDFGSPFMSQAILDAFKAGVTKSIA